MRATFQIFLGLVLGGLSFAQEVIPVVAAKQPIGDAWLGLGVSKPDETTTTQLPALPPGIGFVVTTLEEEGPAKRAGVKQHDLLWKMNEQMLVNEGQLATLLRLADPGDEVTVSVFRKGKAIDLKVTLGETKGYNSKAIRQVLIDSVMRRADGAIRIVNVERKTAAISNEKGSAEVSRLEKGDSVRILDPNGEVIFEGVVSGRPELSAVPQGWRRQVCAMRRGLDHALSAKAAPKRQPRPRIVPPPVEIEK
ncbi:MAG: serine protease [Verrucomicrobia bacterium]|jgi:hypothetical protein|nr:serine protease [Verrucomicrobiota bacterium]|tara:strand:- start:46107 stop:46859 length:753 start_codon:yes stop_codon:yes gene_type:complete